VLARQRPTQPLGADAVFHYAALGDPPLPISTYTEPLGVDILSDVERQLPAAGSAFRLMERVGHFLHLEAPERVEEAVFEWMSSIPSPNRARTQTSTIPAAWRS